MSSRSLLSRLADAALLPLLLLAIGGCDRVPDPAAGLPTGALSYAMKGRVLEIDPAGDTATIEHETVPNFMPAMTMPFHFRSKSLLAGVQPGDAVAFRFVVTKADSWVDRLERIDAAGLELPSAKAAAPEPRTRGGTADRLREGDRMPGFKLIDQDGQLLGPDRLAGAPYLLTFIFTRCPVPQYCPRLMHHFAELQRRLPESAVPGTRLLSLSFDTAFDQPPVLKAYAEAQGAQPQTWIFATGNKPTLENLTKAFAVRVQPENGTISHGLCTVLVGADGIIRALWRGNGWTPDEVLARLAAER